MVELIKITDEFTGMTTFWKALNQNGAMTATLGSLDISNNRNDHCIPEMCLFISVNNNLKHLIMRNTAANLDLIAKSIVGVIELFLFNHTNLVSKAFNLERQWKQSYKCWGFLNLQIFIHRFQH
jgi:hypothetical protein